MADRPTALVMCVVRDLVKKYKTRVETLAIARDNDYRDLYCVAVCLFSCVLATKAMLCCVFSTLSSLRPPCFLPQQLLQLTAWLLKNMFC